MHYHSIPIPVAASGQFPSNKSLGFSAADATLVRVICHGEHELRAAFEHRVVKEWRLVRLPIHSQRSHKHIGDTVVDCGNAEGGGVAFLPELREAHGGALHARAADEEVRATGVREEPKR
jgi:hypothetical protein